MIGIAGNGDGGLTQTAATLIQTLIPPRPRAYTRITSFGYLDAGTAHTITFLRPLGRTVANGANAAGQAVLNLAADPGSAALIYGGTVNAIATNDYIAVRESDGITRLYKVSSVATLAITLTANLAVGTVGGESVWFFGITTDTDGRTGKAHPFLKGGAASAVKTFTDRESGVISSIGTDEPIMVNSNNATNAGTFDSWNWTYTVA